MAQCGKLFPTANSAMPPETLYDALGVARDARHADIVRAYDRLSAEFHKDSSPPDPRREARIREAFEALSDEGSRAAYDEILAFDAAASKRKRVVAIAGIATAAAVVATGAWLYLRRDSSQEKARLAVMEFHAEVVNSVGRVQSIDMSGKATPTGLAFTVAKGFMATTCEGLSPGSQLVVTIGTRPVPARIAMADEALGLCKLAVDGAGSWPLRVGSSQPRAGDKVYAVDVNTTGDAVLVEGAVKRVTAVAPAVYVEASVPVAAGMGGRPLLDRHGRVVAVATARQPGAPARHVFLPPGWGAESPPPAPAAAPSPAEPSPSQPDEAARPAASNDPVQRRAEEIARKLRPPPTVPDDL